MKIFYINKSTKYIFLLLGYLIFFFAGVLAFSQDVKILDIYYDSHWTPGEKPTFTLTAINNDIVINEVYYSVVLTNRSTGKEVTPYPTSPNTLIAANGGTAIISAPTASTQWTATAGSYTVTFILYRTSDDKELDRKYGTFTLEVGYTTDYVSAFPDFLDLGTLQYGRYMHPVPIEVSWSFYSRNFMRKGHPWYMRIYTDNHKRFKGIEGAIYRGRTVVMEGGSTSAFASPAGLISEDGRYTIPLKVWCLNFGPDVEEGWDPNLQGPPPVKDDYYWKGPKLDSGKRDLFRVAWEWIPDYEDMTTDPYTWRRLIGQDPYDTHFVSDSNPSGDFTLPSPFQIYIAYETSPTAVVGKYSTDLIIEIYSP